MAETATFEPRDVDVGTNVAIRGVLRESNLPGILLMTRKKKAWEQRGGWTTAHLSRDYVSGERLSYILEHWIPFDFKDAEAIVLEDHELKYLWRDFEDGQLVWR